uniref:Ig-like domain-containing protein n=1 Tax=Denticeps clupeoides TaxID=299321 RepID=A0AAY4AEC0_9TELE
MTGARGAVCGDGAFAQWHLSRSVLCNKVNQSPSESIQNAGESLRIECPHSIKLLDRILWYKQTQDRGFALMGYLFYEDPSIESEFKDKIQLDGEATTDKMNSMTINAVSPSDSAVYYCAAYTTVLQTPSHQYKNPPAYLQQTPNSILI